jgi:hypothetical protein
LEGENEVDDDSVVSDDVDDVDLADLSDEVGLKVN